MRHHKGTIQTQRVGFSPITGALLITNITLYHELYIHMLYLIFLTFGLFAGFISCLFYKNNWFSKPSPQSIQTKAKHLGLDDANLTTSMGGMDTHHYELFQRIRSEEAYKMTATAQLFAIISAGAAVMSAIAAIITTLQNHH